MKRPLLSCRWIVVLCGLTGGACLGLFRADAIAGPTGAALRRVLGGRGAWALVGGLVRWIVTPLTIAGQRLARRDL